MISRVKGTQDFLDLTMFNFLIDQFRAHCTRYNISEISTPILEQYELFQRSIGESTDIVSKEMFMIEKGESSTRMCLRPEATASTTRAFLEAGVQVTPWKVFSWGPMFRYERPQKGRFRQFHQMNIEVIGAESVAYDVQTIVMLDRFFHDVLRINNYALAINTLGCSADRIRHRIAFTHYLQGEVAEKICETCKVRVTQNILRVFDCKNPECKEIIQAAPRTADYLCDCCGANWKQLQDQLLLLSVSYVVSPLLVRGLDYYEGTVFEFISDNLGAQNAFCGGGRYELAQQLGNRDRVPSIGAAIGLERLILLMEATVTAARPVQKQELYAVLPLGAAQVPLALLIADELRAAGFVIDAMLEGESIKTMMRHANKFGATYALIIGEDEQATKQVMVRNMLTGDQQLIPQAQLKTHLSR